MAVCYHQLGVLAQQRGDDGAALDWYRKALAINEQLGNRASMASTISQLGTMALARGDHDAALDWYKKSLAIRGATRQSRRHGQLLRPARHGGTAPRQL